MMCSVSKFLYCFYVWLWGMGYAKGVRGKFLPWGDVRRETLQERRSACTEDFLSSLLV